MQKLARFAIFPNDIFRNNQSLCRDHLTTETQGRFGYYPSVFNLPRPRIEHGGTDAQRIVQQRHRSTPKETQGLHACRQ